ncbi:hypothetical protein RhiXN_08941 [Rhizoctonia solani]|uniref:Uncharacterized protein n=1 Tax=Rhizoctonia solani TaxID=456999 RepID=A0A8H8NTX3_9AGAM|nr:uncharacterized protein RhiXN_08941 [Rhizoctonia solani]QRW19966.1 hypothetical protein RhiXN_08941 [Rhizoctonia solani]
MKLFAVIPVLVTLVTKATGSPSNRLRMLNQSQLQGEGCKLLRRACPGGHVCSGVYYLPDATGPVFKAVMSAQGVLSVKLGYAFQAISKDLHQEVLSVA